MATLTLTVNNVGNPESVTASTVCREVVIGEDPSVGGYPTTAYKVRHPLATSPAIQVEAGKRYAFVKETYFQPNDIIGYVETVTGSTTFQQDEHA